MTTITNIRDMREIARRRIPRAIFDYARSGSYDEITIRANRADFDALRFRQKVMVDVSAQAMARPILGEVASMPLAIAPTGLTGLFHADGEILGARAAEAFGIPFCLSTMSICSIEDVAAEVEKPFWFQLYVMRDRGFTKSLVERAAAARCSALVLTVDLPLMAQRHRDIKNGLSVPPRLTLANALDMATKPSWVFKILTAKRRSFGNLAGQMAKTDKLESLLQWVGGQFDLTLNWRDVEWIRGLWSGKLIIKGILDPQDAKLAVDAGADAIVVSNHGGRQLDSAPSTISVLPEIVEAVAGRAEVMLDGGIETGQDILKARALGANNCLMGKSFLYALAAGGEAGVTRALEILRDELRVSMALTGVNDIADVDARILYNGPNRISGQILKDKTK